MAFENNELSMNGQVISNRCYASAVKLYSTVRFGGIKNKMLKNTDFDQKIKLIEVL